MTCALPTDLAEPEKRLRAVRQATLAAKARHALSARTPTGPRRVSRFRPWPPGHPALIARTRLASRVRLPINLVISNVPGPEQPYRVGGALVEGLYPAPALSDGLESPSPCRDTDDSSMSESPPAPTSCPTSSRSHTTLRQLTRKCVTLG